MNKRGRKCPCYSLLTGPYGRLLSCECKRPKCNIFNCQCLRAKFEYADRSNLLCDCYFTSFGPFTGGELSEPCVMKYCFRRKIKIPCPCLNIPGNRKCTCILDRFINAMNDTFQNDLASALKDLYL